MLCNCEALALWVGTKPNVPMRAGLKLLACLNCLSAVLEKALHLFFKMWVGKK